MTHITPDALSVDALSPDAPAEDGLPAPVEDPRRTTGGLAAAPAPLAYLSAVVMVGFAVLADFLASHLVAGSNLTLVFVAPVLAAAIAFGWGPALAAAVLGVAAFDFFFTQPYFSLQVDSPADLWAMALLALIALVVSALSAEARRRTLEARLAADRAEALQALAHLVIEGRAPREVLAGAASALSRIFRAPAVVFVRAGEGARLVAAAGGARPSQRDGEAALGALKAGLHTQAETYPYDAARFDFWPVAGRLAVGVDFTRSSLGRPARPERFVEVVAAYLASGPIKG